MSSNTYASRSSELEGGIRLGGLDRNVELRQSSRRQTPDTSFGTTLQRGVRQGASVAERVAASAGYSIPGRAVVGAALEAAAEVRDGEGMGSAASPLASGGGTNSYLAKQAQAGDTGARVALETQAMHQQNFANSVALLNMQNTMQDEQKRFSMVSNLSKARYDTHRNCISNLK